MDPVKITADNILRKIEYKIVFEVGAYQAEGGEYGILDPSGIINAVYYVFLLFLYLIFQLFNLYCFLLYLFFQLIVIALELSNHQIEFH